MDLEPNDADWEALMRISGPLVEERLRSIILQRMNEEALVELEALWQELVDEEPE